MTITKLWIDEGCISCNACEDLAPDIFEVDDDCEVKMGVDFTDNDSLIREAAEACPVEVILFEEA